MNLLACIDIFEYMHSYVISKTTISKITKAHFYLRCEWKSHFSLKLSTDKTFVRAYENVYLRDYNDINM